MGVGQYSPEMLYCVNQRHMLPQQEGIGAETQRFSSMT
jgi:hypothetical protein